MIGSEFQPKVAWPSFGGELPGGQVAWRALGGEFRMDGGDFCDLLTLDDGSSLAVCGHASGHGMRAAAAARAVRETVRQVSRVDASLARCVERVNDRLVRKWAGQPRTTFATAALIRIRPSEHGLYVVSASAGHPLPLVLRADRSLVALGRPGPRLGLFPDLHVELGQTVLRPGDAIVLCTQGVVDGADPFSGHPSLADLVRGCAGASAEDIGACVMLAVAEATTQIGDSRALLVIRAGDGPAATPRAFGRTSSRAAEEDLVGII